jgi:hypothetical protein
MNPTQEMVSRLNSILIQVTEINQKLSSGTSAQIDNLLFSLSFFIGVFTCAYLFTFLRDVFSK